MRLLDLNASDLKSLTSDQLVSAIRNSEGRVIASEVVAVVPPMIDKVSNPELAASMGADILLLNFYDALAPQVMGFPAQQAAPSGQVFGKFPMGFGVTLGQVKEWTGRVVGVNLEPIENPSAMTTNGRLATAENAVKVVEQGADMIVITGNPHTGVSVDGIIRSVASIRGEIGNTCVLLAGKMHGAGSDSALLNVKDIERLKKAGADGILLPAPGTIPGITVERALAIIEQAHQNDLLCMNAIGTSQEGASVATIEQIALWSKMSGADIHHIGDAGTIGIAIPENIYAFSIAIRGRRHTWHRMAASSMR